GGGGRKGGGEGDGLRAAVDGGDGREGADRPAEAAQVERADVLGLDASVGEAVRRLADQDLARPGRLLQTGGHIDGLAGREGRVGLVDDDLARLDADARLDAGLLGALDDAERRADAALRLVLVRLRAAASRHASAP